MGGKVSITRRRLLIVVAIALILGIGIGGIGKTQTVEKEVIKKVPVEKEVKVFKSEDTWRNLKSIDDELLKIAITNTELCSGALYALSNGDTGTITEIEKQVKENRVKFQESTQKRVEEAKKLGY